VVPNPAGQSLHVTRIPRGSFSGFSLSFQLSRSVGCQKLHIALSVFVTLLNMDLVKAGGPAAALVISTCMFEMFWFPA
jgi:hypothetical protein